METRELIPLLAAGARGRPAEVAPGLGLRLLRELGRSRELRGCRTFGDAGWTILRSGDENPWTWTSREGVEELADLVNYWIRFRARLDPPAGRGERVGELLEAIGRKAGELVVLEAELQRELGAVLPWRSAGGDPARAGR